MSQDSPHIYETIIKLIIKQIHQVKGNYEQDDFAIYLINLHKATLVNLAIPKKRA